jgi:hypothetical protein
MTYVIGRVDLTIGLALFGLIIAAGGILFHWIMSRSTNKLIANGEERTNKLIGNGQELMKTMHTETQQTLAAINQTQANMGQILERMDQRADERYRDLRGRIDGEV